MRVRFAPSSSLTASLLLPLVVAACSASSAPADDGQGAGDASGKGGSKTSAKGGTGGTEASGGNGDGDAGEGGSDGDGAGTGGAGGTATAGSGGAGGSGGTGGTGGTLGTGGTDGGTGGTGGTGDAGAGGGVVVEPPVEVSTVYAHSPTELYRMAPATKDVTLVGTFDCLGGLFGTEMIDLAIDSTGKMVGTAFDGLYSINPNTAKCTKIKDGSFPNSLTFIPKGVLDPNAETLVGFKGAEYVRIDSVSGKITTIGNLNPDPAGESWESSGDVVSIIGDKTYLTVHPPGAGYQGPDSIVEVNPVNGKIVKVIGNVGFGKLWGLAFWDSVAYAFSEDGKLIQIDLSTGKGVNVPLGSKVSGLSFYGAGVTTAARITPPK